MADLAGLERSGFIHQPIHDWNLLVGNDVDLGIVLTETSLDVDLRRISGNKSLDNVIGTEQEESNTCQREEYSSKRLNSSITVNVQIDGRRKEVQFEQEVSQVLHELI